METGGGISIHAAREGGDAGYAVTGFNREISIHAAREGGDGYTGRRRIKMIISIHAAREGGDCSLPDWKAPSVVISIHAAREGGDSGFLSASLNAFVFQSTPPVKAATPSKSSMYTRQGFQSTPPVKAATIYYLLYYITFPISIHAAREGGDKKT